jgi:DNA-binding MarR family transcriptional regulator
MQNVSSPQVSTSFYVALLEFLLSAKQHVAAIGESHGLTSVQTITLLLIDPNQPRPMKNFCGLFHCDASNVTGIIDGLEQKGLVSRQNDPSDRRIKVVCLEAAGTSLQQTILAQIAHSNGFLFDPLSSSEAEQFVHIVRKLAAR